MIGSVLAMAGIVLSFIALGMRPSFDGEPLGKLPHFAACRNPRWQCWRRRWPAWCWARLCS